MYMVCASNFPKKGKKKGWNSKFIFICSMNGLQVCVTEGVNAHPVLLEKFIQACDGDIRKTIMHLQFWLHSKKFSKGE